MRVQVIHNLRGNKVERSPHRLFVWDTETQTRGTPDREVLTHRVWAAETVERHGRRPGRPRVHATWGQSLEGLADALEAGCLSDATTWCWAHNQGFDLAVTRLPLLLIQRGWVLTQHALASESPWARMARRRKRIVLADSSSWLPGSLASIGVSVGIDKPPLPDEADDGDQWAWRCRQDVRILTTALCELMDWWDRCKLGSWSITGPATGFNAMRHMHNPHTVVIDPDPDARAFERTAIMSGRREVWRVGRQPAGDYRELDFRSAHATIASVCPLPKRRSVRFETLELGDWRLTSDRWAPIAWATVRTLTPRYPLSYSDRIFYPVGTFRTLLCGPELAEAHRRQELVTVGPGWIYQLGAHMAPWGRWVLQQLATPDPDTPEVARTAIKAWSRRVPGKWAARTGRLFHSGPAAEQGWRLEHGRHHPSGVPCTVLDVAGRREILLQDQDTDDCFPAVLAWIQSEVRVRLGRLVDAVGAGRMLGCNTDGLFMDARTWQPPADLAARLLPLQVREKQRLPWVDVISPQHVILPTERRLSGVPGNAEEVAPGQYRWMTWPRLPAQIASGEAAGYVRETRSVDLGKVPVNRWVLANGSCQPVQAEIGEDGQTRLLPRRRDLLGDTLRDLTDDQHPVLERLLRPV